MMAASSNLSAGATQSALLPARRSTIQKLLRLEGLAVAAVTALLYARTGVSWWLFAALWLAPDLSMLGYLAGACRGARVDNGIHNDVGPAVLGLCAYLLHANVVAVAGALIWANHVAVDRMLGFGLKCGEGFSYTHLGRVGKDR